jgi:acetyl esterase/lipase
MMKKRRILELTIFSALLIGVSGCGFIMNNNTSSSSENSSESESSSSTSQIDPSAVVAGGVIAETHSNVPNAYYFHSIPYYSYEDEEGYRYVANTYKEGGVNYHEYNVNDGEDFLVSKQKNNFDLYVPRSLSKDANNTVVLFIHGGAWISGLKTDVNPYVHEFANRGYISATLKYTLLNADMNDDSLSIFRDLDEIDACINEIKECLEELEFDTNKVNIAIGGASSGAHLTMLYTYSRGVSCPLPIKFIVDAVGPVDIKSVGWKAFVDPSAEALDAGLSYAAIEAQKDAGNLRTLEIAGQKDEEHNQLYWNEYQTLRISNGMCGLPYSLDTVKEASSNKQDITDPSNEAYVSMSKTNGGQDLLSVTYWINKSSAKYPMVCAYAGKDSIVGIAQYARLEKAMDDQGIDHDYIYFRNANHTDISKEKDETHYNQFVAAIMARLAA